MENEKIDVLKGQPKGLQRVLIDSFLRRLETKWILVPDFLA